MTFRRLFPIILITAFISALYVLFAQALQISAMWLPFISWTFYCLDGANPKRLFNLVFGFTMGMLIGLATVMLINPMTAIFGATFALPIIVFFMVIIILLAELVKPVNSVPAYFFAYSSYFAYYYGKFGGVSQTPINIIPLFWTLSLFGFGLGVITMAIRRKLLNSLRKK